MLTDYTSKDKARTRKARGRFEIEKVADCKEREDCFDIHTAQGEVIHTKAAYEMDRMMWMKMIQRGLALEDIRRVINSPEQLSRRKPNMPVSQLSPYSGWSHLTIILC